MPAPQLSDSPRPGAPRAARARGRVARVLLTLALGIRIPILAAEITSVSITPAATGPQLVRFPLVLPPGVLHTNDVLVAHSPTGPRPASVRTLTTHGEVHAGSIRTALVTFDHPFEDTRPVPFRLLTAAQVSEIPSSRVSVRLNADALHVRWHDGPTLQLGLRAPARASTIAPRIETVETNAHYLWQRLHLADDTWPRVIEVRADRLGGVVVVAHLQRKLAGNGWAPELGWEVIGDGAPGPLRPGVPVASPDSGAARHAFTGGHTCEFLFAGDRFALRHPAAPLKRHGTVEVSPTGSGGFRYLYRRADGGDRVPMQSAAWQRAEIALGPALLAPLTPALLHPHHVRESETTPTALDPRLEALLRFHHVALIHASARGPDWGNLTGYSEGAPYGGAFGMNRLNHCPPLFAEARLSGNAALRETALLWCDNFFDQSIWWGQDQTGCTRYNNIQAQNRTPPDTDTPFMWRSDDAVSFCTKGYDAFLLAYEATGDPRMLEALNAQVAYARQHLRVDTGECRNIGDVRDFVILYERTGDRSHLDQALRLFRELRTRLSANGLFSQSGHPLEADPPFIEEDDFGYRHPFTKPYILGYALAGLPLLARHVPDEPRLREVIEAVAEFMAASQDPIGGWRYPHPRSSHVILSQGIEHAWQLVQACELLGPRDAYLDAIERVLRQRIHGWLRTGRIPSGLNGWELTTGRARKGSELQTLYRRPEDRDRTRDYTEGHLSLGSAPPEGLAYFPEVLRFHLRHRPAERLLAPPHPDEPLGLVLGRAEALR